MRHHRCIIENRGAYRDHMAALRNIVDALAKNVMPDHTREELEAALEQGHARAKELIAERLGMHLAWRSDDEAFNKAVENYLGEGGAYKHVADGMVAMQQELKKQQREAQREADAQRGQSEWDALSDDQPTGEASPVKDAQHRSAYHNHLRRKAGLDLDERIFPLAKKV
jgi:peptidoglycan/xylan/chitin deacetylase (PgdA/CDA1 family)